MEDEKVTQKFKELYSKESEYEQITNYLFLLCKDKLDYGEMLEIAKCLIDEENLTVDGIVNGKESYLVDKYIKCFLVRKKSVLAKNEEVIELPLMTQKQQKDLDFIKTSKFNLKFISLLFGYKYSEDEYWDEISKGEVWN